MIATSAYTRAEYVSAVERMLASRKVGLWGAFDISDSKGRRKAAEWLTVQVEETVRFLPEHPPLVEGRPEP